MLKINAYKKFLTVFLVLVFFSPTLIKAAHLFYAEHQHEFVLNSNTVKINESHSDCPICKFEFTQIIATQNYYETTHHLLVSDVTPLFNNDIVKSSTQLSFNLRAPPFSS